MKRLALIISALALSLTASTSFAAEQHTWGGIKQQLTDGPAAKRTKTTTLSASSTTLSASTAESDLTANAAIDARTVTQWVYPGQEMGTMANKMRQ